MRTTNSDSSGNVVLYAVSRSARERVKRVQARELLARSGLAVSVQVLQEFYVQATGQKFGYTHDEARLFAAWLKRFPTQAMTVKVFDLATTIHERHGVQYWDAAILAAAKTLGCATVWSEDMSHGQDYDGVTVMNPFIDAKPA